MLLPTVCLLFKNRNLWEYRFRQQIESIIGGMGICR